MVPRLNRVITLTCACALPLLAGCRSHRVRPVPVEVDEETAYQHILSAEVPLRLSDAEWKTMQADRCRGSLALLQYEIKISTSGEVEDLRLLDEDGMCGPIPIPPKPLPVVQAHLGEAEKLVRSMRFAPWVVNGRPVAVITRTSLSIGPPERYGPAVPFPAVVNPATVSMGLERGGCDGECPAYSVVVASDGTVTYQGNGFVAVPGRHIGHIAPTTVTRLLSQFREANFLSALPEYEGASSGGVILSLSVNGKTYRVIDAYGIRMGIPTKILALEQALDRETGTELWVRGNRDFLPAMEQEHWDFAASSQDNLRLYDQAIWRKDSPLLERFLAARAPVFVNPSAGAPSWAKSDPPPIVAASGMGDVALVKRMLATTTQPVTAPILFHSVLEGFGSGKIEMVNFWMDRGADPRRKPITLDGKPETMSEDVDPLRKAIASGNADVVKRALSLGFDVNGKMGMSGPPLIFAFEGTRPADFNPEVVRLLLAAGADPNARSPIGETALFDAKTVDVLQMLLAAGTNPNLSDDLGYTALVMHAHDVAALRILLKAGADPTLRDKDGKTILDAIAEDSDCPSCREEVSGALRTRGVNPETFYKAGHR